MIKITTQEELDDIADKFCGFHDSMLIDVQFHPQTSFFENDASVTLKFDNSGWWEDDLILKFDKLESFIFNPNKDSYPILWDAVLKIDDSCVRFLSNARTIEDFNPEDSNTIYVKSKSLSYEFVEHIEDDE